MDGRCHVWFFRFVLPLFLIAPCAGVGTSATAPAGGPASRPAANDIRIRELVRQLSHPVHARRRAAIRQLAEWGPAAFSELRRVAQSGDLEAALSARDLLAELESAVLIGAHVRLEVDRTRVRWGEAFTVTLHAANPTSEPITAPWGLGTNSPNTQPSEEDARQVAALMDVGDFLVVTGPEGQPIELRVDPIERDRKVYEAVNVRSNGTPPSHPIAGGAADRLVMPLFNRGWARYPMLSAGRYTIFFSYQPQWKDPTWIRAGFGLVRSEPVTIEVIEPAPKRLCAADSPIRLRLKRDGDSWVAELESTWDRDLWINLNLGDDLETHARVEWRLMRKEAGEDEEPVRWHSEPTGHAFRVDRLRRLGPGERLDIGRETRDALREKAGKLAETASEVVLTVRYISLGSAPQVREELSERGRSVEVPSGLYSGTLTSGNAPLEPAKPDGAAPAARER